MKKTIVSTSTVEKGAENFRYYATTVYPDRSPLYVNLAMRVAEDPELLKIAVRAHGKNALPNLFFGAVHFLLLKGDHHQLAAFYPSINRTTRQYDYIYPYFRSFVLEHELEIGDIMETRSVQTNEVARCAILVPAFELVAQEAHDRSLAMIEIGSSAGLTLLWDQYHYRFADDLQCGPSNSPVQIECELHGPKKPTIPDKLPKITWRQGIDLNPLDLNNPDNVLWLRALVWPEHEKRARQLEQAIENARRDPPRIIRGDVFELLSNLLDRLEDDAQLCVYHSFTLLLAGKEPRERLQSILRRASQKRNLFWISFEWARDSETPLLEFTKFEQMKATGRRLARAQAHGEWIEWLG